MKNLIATAAAALITTGAAAPAMADDHMDKKSDWKAKSPVVVERNDEGKATKVRIDGKMYDVCMTFEQDDCINPRAAGLKWGNRPLQYWPGQPASQS